MLSEPVTRMTLTVNRIPQHSNVTLYSTQVFQYKLQLCATQNLSHANLKSHIRCHSISNHTPDLKLSQKRQPQITHKMPRRPQITHPTPNPRKNTDLKSHTRPQIRAKTPISNQTPNSRKNCVISNHTPDPKLSQASTSLSCTPEVALRDAGVYLSQTEMVTLMPRLPWSAKSWAMLVSKTRQSLDMMAD